MCVACVCVCACSIGVCVCQGVSCKQPAKRISQRVAGSTRGHSKARECLRKGQAGEGKFAMTLMPLLSEMKDVHAKEK